MQKKKIKLKITKLKKGGVVTLGAITKDLLTTLNNRAPKQWNNANHNKRLFYYNNNGNVFGHTISDLKTFSLNSNIEVSFQGDKMKINMKRASG